MNHIPPAQLSFAHTLHLRRYRHPVSAMHPSQPHLHPPCQRSFPSVTLNYKHNILLILNQGHPSWLPNRTKMDTSSVHRYVCHIFLTVSLPSTHSSVPLVTSLISCLVQFYDETPEVARYYGQADWTAASTAPGAIGASTILTYSDAREAWNNPKGSATTTPTSPPTSKTTGPSEHAFRDQSYVDHPSINDSPTSNLQHQHQHQYQHYSQSSPPRSSPRHIDIDTDRGQFNQSTSLPSPPHITFD